MAYATLEVANFHDIDRALGTHSRSLPLALNTVAYRTVYFSKSDIAISYHGNDIAIYNTSTGAIKLTTSGWDTPTTIDRLDQIARANNIGTVSKVGGRARFTHTAKDYGWYSMDEPVKVHRDGKVEHNDPDRLYGYSNADTWSAVALASNPLGGESEYRALMNMSRAHLRQWIKHNRKEIGYSTIDKVNIREVHNALHDGEDN